MKIQLDLDNKRIKVEQEVNMGDFFNTIKKLLPDNLWKEFTFDPTVINNWSNPIIIKEYPTWPITSPSIPWHPNSPYPWITYGTTSTPASAGDYSNQVMGGKYQLQAGTFNLDCPQV